MHTLFVNDNSLRLFSNEEVCATRGYALLEGDAVHFDVGGVSEPISQTRSHPDRVNSRYWQSCDESAIGPNGAGLRHSADLIWAHLTELKQQFSIDALQFIVPAHYQNQQLQLLVGIAKAAGITPMALVNKAVLAHAACDAANADRFVFLDIQLHQTVVSTLQRESKNGEAILSHTAYEVTSGCSVSKFQDALLNHLQARFIEQDRFDPLHHAETEQQLFNQLDGAAASIAQNGAAAFSVNFKQKVLKQNIDESAWKQIVLECLANLPELGDGSLMVDFNAAFYQPLNQATVKAFNDRVSVLPSLQTQLNVLEAAGVNYDEQTAVYLTELKLSREPGSTTTSEPATREAPSSELKSATKSLAETDLTIASHLLLNGVAQPIETAQLDFINGGLSFADKGSSVQSMLSTSALQSVSGGAVELPLGVGQRLVSELGDGVITAIKVRP